MYLVQIVYARGGLVGFALARLYPSWFGEFFAAGGNLWDQLGDLWAAARLPPEARFIQALTSVRA